MHYRQATRRKVQCVENRSMNEQFDEQSYKMELGALLSQFFVANSEICKPIS